MKARIDSALERPAEALADAVARLAAAAVGPAHAFRYAASASVRTDGAPRPPAGALGAP